MPETRWRARRRARLRASGSPLCPIMATRRGDLGRVPPPGGRTSTKIYHGAGNMGTKRPRNAWGWTREWVTREQKGRGCVGSRLAGRSGREAKRAAAPGLGGSCGAQPRTHLRHEALDLDKATKSQAKVSLGAKRVQDLCGVVEGYPLSPYSRRGLRAGGPRPGRDWTIPRSTRLQRKRPLVCLRRRRFQGKRVDQSPGRRAI